MFAARLSLSIGLLLWGPGALAQATVGALLEAGAKPLPVAQFKEEVVQRTLVGPTPTGGKLEIMYTIGGRIQGSGRPESPRSTLWESTQIFGDWTADEKGRICTAMRVPGWTSGSIVVLPTRCQYWFKLDDKYFFADSDTDRSAKVLSRTIKQ